MQVLRAAPTSAKLTFLYCLPAILAISLVLLSYYERTNKVACFIEDQRRLVNNIHDGTTDNRNGTNSSAHLSVENVLGITKDEQNGTKKETYSKQLKQLIGFYIRETQRKDAASSLRKANEIRDAQYCGIPAKDASPPNDKDKFKCLVCNGKPTPVPRTITDVIYKTWQTNAIMIAILAILPYLLLGTHLGFSTRQHATFEVRRSIVNKSWWMKFLIALILTYGWIYVVNPTGRGTGTLDQFLIKVDLYQAESLPELLKGGIVQPIIAGFLGWYLYLLTYFFSKVFTHDVLSTNAYGLMFQKFLFTYGVAIILPSVQVANGAAAGIDTTIVTAFFIGFFPMSAFSMLKDTSIKVLKGGQPEKGQLQELPGISRWQILRLEEEGIDSMGALAAHNRPAELRRNIPAMSNLIDYWIDIARLYTVLGQDTYQQVKKHCRTASEFVLKANDEAFIQALATDNVINPSETARILRRTFTEALGSEIKQ